MQEGENASNTVAASLPEGLSDRGLINTEN